MAGLHESLAILHAVQTGEKERSALEHILKDSEMKTMLASFVHETQTRPELVSLIQIEDTLKDYLQLSPDERQQIEELRQQSPEYMKGEFVESPIYLSGKKPKNLSASAFELFRKISAQNNISKIVDAYVNKQPTNNFEQPVSLKTWFQCYDMNATFLTPKKDGKKEHLRTPPGHKHYQHWRRNIKPTGVDFEDWIESQITPELKERLQQTLYYQQEKLSITQIVQAYINKQPTNKREQPVSLTTWFKCYDMNATFLTPKKDGKRERLGTPPGHKHYYYWHRNIKPTGVSFEDWIESQITPELKERLQQTLYYQQEKLNITQIVQAYINKQPTNKFEQPVSLTAWFLSYDMNAEFLRPKKDGKKNVLAYPQETNTTRTGRKKSSQQALILRIGLNNNSKKSVLSSN